MDSSEWARALQAGDRIIIAESRDGGGRTLRRRSKTHSVSPSIIWVDGLHFHLHDGLIRKSGAHWWKLLEPTDELWEEVGREEENHELSYQVGHGIQILHRSWEVTPYDVPTELLSDLNSKVSELRQMLFDLHGEACED